MEDHIIKDKLRLFALAGTQDVFVSKKTGKKIRKWSTTKNDVKVLLTKNGHLEKESVQLSLF